MVFARWAKPTERSGDREEVLTGGQCHHRLGRFRAGRLRVRVQHPGLGVLDRQTSRRIVHHIGVDPVAGLDDDLVALVQLQQMPKRLAMGHPVAGDGEVADLTGRSGAGVVTDTAVEDGQICAREDGHLVVLPERGNAQQRDRVAGDHRGGEVTVRRPALLLLARLLDRPLPDLAQLGRLLLERLLRGDVGAEVLPCHPAQAADARGQQQGPDDGQHRHSSRRKLTARYLLGVGEIILQGLCHRAIVPAADQSRAPSCLGRHPHGESARVLDSATMSFVARHRMLQPAAPVRGRR